MSARLLFAGQCLLVGTCVLLAAVLVLRLGEIVGGWLWMSWRCLPALAMDKYHEWLRMHSCS